MENIVFNVGNGLCWGVGMFLNSPVCHTRSHEIYVGYLFFAVVAFMIAWTVNRRLTNI
jgi:hypothetical protein